LSLPGWTRPKILRPLSFRRHYLYHIPGLQLVLLPQPPLRPPVQGEEEALADVGVDPVGEVLRRRALLHQVGVREDDPVPVRPLPLVLHREDGYVFEKLEDRPVEALLNPGPACRLEDGPDLLQACLLGSGEVFYHLKVRVARSVSDRAGFIRHPQRHLGGGAGGNDDLVQSLQAGDELGGGDVHLVCGDDHRLAGVPQETREPLHVVVSPLRGVALHRRQGPADVVIGDPGARQLLGDEGLDLDVLGPDPPHQPLPVAVEDPEEPHPDLALEKLHIRQGVVVSYADGVTLRVGGAGGVQDVDDRLRHPEAVQKLVTEALTQMGVGDEPGHVDQLHGDVPRPFPAPAALRRELPAGAGDPDVRDPVVRIDGGEGVVCYLHLG